MKFPRNIKLLRSPFEVAPFAAVFLILLIFMLLSALMPVPGLQMQLNLPTAENLPGTGKPSVVVAVGADGRFYFENQMVDETRLRAGLANAAKNSSEPLTLVIHADKSATYEQLLQLTLLARAAGIYDALLATQPRFLEPPVKHE